MEPFKEDALTDAELDGMLPAWETPDAPVWLRAAVFPEGTRPWWKKLWGASVRIPLPVAVCLAILVAMVVFWRATPVMVYRRRVLPAAATGVTNSNELLPVAVIRPRIVRNASVQN